MGYLTNILAVIKIDTGIYDYSDDKEFAKNFDAVKIVQNALANAPKITGSECNADIFVHKMSGNNVSQYHKDNTTSAYQTRAVITIIGSLMDRDPETTEREYDDFRRFIEENFEIINAIVGIY